MWLEDDQQFLLCTNAARDKAEAVLERLMRLKYQAENQREYSRYATRERVHQCESAFDQAIATTQSIIEHLNVELHELEQDMGSAKSASCAVNSDSLEGDGLFGDEGIGVADPDMDTDSLVEAEGIVEADGIYEADGPALN